MEYLRIKNVHLVIGDGSSGWVASAPFQRIVISAAAPQVPPLLLAQMAEESRLIAPVGSRGFQHLEIWIKEGSEIYREISTPVVFVPLRGEYGWEN